MTFLPEVTAAATATTIDRVFDLFVGRRQQKREDRQRAANQLLSALVPIVEELRMYQWRRRPKRWKKLLRRLYAALDVHAPIFPHQWRHLKRSVRDSVGNAVGGGVVFVDLLDIQDDAELALPSRWTMHGADYLDGTVSVIRRWGTTRSSWRAHRTILPTFDAWVTANNLQH